MTMEFALANESLATGLKPGAPIDFDFDYEDAGLTEQQFFDMRNKEFFEPFERRFLGKTDRVLVHG